jgi:enoyl-CoA hydratase
MISVEETMSVEFRVHDAVAFLTLSRPEVLNAIDHAVLDGIERGVREASSDRNVKVLVFSGAGERAFCAGADLALVKALSGEAKRRYIERAYAVLETVAAAPLPTIAALHGFVLGGGLELALACDIRVADAPSTFGLPEIALGSVPSFGAVQRLPRVIGHAS